MKGLFSALGVVLLVISLAGCSSTRQTETPPPSSTPATSAGEYQMPRFGPRPARPAAEVLSPSPPPSPSWEHPADAVVKTQDDAGGTVELNRGQALMVELPGNPTTGYLWAVSEYDPEVVTLLGQDFQVADPGLPGAPGLFLFHFVGRGTGTTGLTLVYQRPWEAEETPARTYRLTVEVQ